MKTAPKRSHILLLSFLIPAAMMTAVFALAGICPFGSGSLGVMDMSHQYLSFLYSLRDILTGEASLLYLPSMCLGGNMTGVAAYYLLSPLNLLTCLFPREGMLTAVSVLFILRVGLCGLTMGVYCSSRSGWGWRTLVPAMAYAFMAYMLAYSFNYLWQDCVILLPLIALGIWRLVEGRSWWLYTLCLGGALFMNFYIGYILCLFSVLFFLYEALCRTWATKKEPGMALLRFALASLAAGALAAVAILPAFMSLMGGKAEFSLSVLTLAPKFPLGEIFAKLYTGAFVYEEIMPAGLPQIFTGAVTTALAVLYFANRAIPRKRRILTGCLLVLLALSFWITALDLIWHCLNNPSWYNYRYSFLFSFLLAAAADRELASWREGFRPWHALLPAGLCLAATAVTFLGRSYDFVTWHSAIGAVLVALAVGGGMWLASREGAKPSVTRLLAMGLLLLHGLDLGANAWISLKDLTVPASDPALYAEYVTGKEEAFALVPEDGTYTRVESASTHDMNRCEPMLFGYDGISHYGSTISQKSLDALDRLGFDRYTDLWSLYGAGVTASADTLLGIRYLVDAATPKAYTPVAQAGGYTLWENENALPVAWTADEAFAGTVSARDSFEHTDALYAAAAPEVGGSLFAEATLEDIVLTNCSADGAVYTPADGGMASIEYVLTAQADGRLYGEFDIPDFPGVVIFANNAFVAAYASAQTNGTVYLGTYTAGDTVTVKLQAAVPITINHAAFATEQDGALAAYAQALKAGGCDLQKHSAAHYSGSFTTGEGDELLVLTIPHDAAWRVTLDGEPAAPLEAQDCYMAISVTEGTHTIELRYVPAGLVPGAVITGLAIAAAALVLILQKRSRR